MARSTPSPVSRPFHVWAPIVLAAAAVALVATGVRMRGRAMNKGQHATIIAPQNAAGGGRLGVDLILRRNEILCVRSGINPYDVWSGARTSTVFRPFDKPGPGQAVHTYPPWEYTLAMPLSFLSPRAAGNVMECVLLLCAGIVATWCYRRGRAATGSWRAGVFCAALALLTGLPLHEDIRSQNYYLVCTAATIGLVASLNRGRQILGGICWALMMVKPQYGVLFAIPILWRKQFTTLAVAVSLCLALAVPPALMTHTPLVEIILQAGRAGNEYFIRSGLIPAMAFQPLAAKFGHALPALGSAALGIGLCLWMTWQMRRRRDWFEFLLPTVFCTTIWTYCLVYGHVPYALLLCFAAERLWRARPGRETWLRAIAVAAMVNGLLLYFPFWLSSGDWIASHLAPGAAPDTLRRLSRLADLPFFGVSYLATYVMLAWIILVARRAARTPPEEDIP